MNTARELEDLRKKAYQSTVIANDLRARAAREDERAAGYRKQLGHTACQWQCLGMCVDARECHCRCHQPRETP